MPYIHMRVNVSLSEKQEEILKNEWGKAIALLPGKSETWLMVDFEDNCHLYFKGSNKKPLAFVEVKIFGKSDADSYDRLTAQITETLHQEVGIDAQGIYIQYEEAPYWGWNGHNF